MKFAYDYSDTGVTSKIRGTTNFRYSNKQFTSGSTSIDTNDIKLNLTYGFSQFHDTLKVIGRCPSKYVSISEMQGVYILPKGDDIKPAPKRKWNLSVSMGYMYVPADNKLAPCVGLTLGYSLLRWGK